MNILILGINGEIGKSIFQNLYNKRDNFVLIYNKKKPKINEKNVFSKKIDFKFTKNAIIKFKKIIKKFNSIDVLVNNAGDSNPFKDIFKINLKEFNKNMNINFYSSFFLILEVIKKQIRKKKKLRIINISSNTIKYLGSNKNVPYLISKNAMELALLNLSKQFSSKYIRINIIRPGLINTKKNTKINNYSKKNFNKRISLIPLRKPGTPRDVANLVKFLASDQSEYIYGEVISLAGGE